MHKYVYTLYAIKCVRESKRMKEKNERKRIKKKKEKKDIAYYILVENAGYCLKKYTREA